jgi:hypothetical protein
VHSIGFTWIYNLVATNGRVIRLRTGELGSFSEALVQRNGLRAGTPRTGPAPAQAQSPGVPPRRAAHGDVIEPALRPRPTRRAPHSSWSLCRPNALGASGEAGDDTGRIAWDEPPYYVIIPYCMYYMPYCMGTCRIVWEEPP